MNYRSRRWRDWRVYLLNLYTRFTKLEYLPIYIINIPVFLIYLFYAIKARHLMFFTATNPTLHTGGLFGLDKAAILHRIDPRFIPASLTIKPKLPFDEVMSRLTLNDMTTYPLIAKPVVGERGLGVARINDESELRSYHQGTSTPYMVQQFVGYAEEYSVLYVRFPGSEKGEIPSFCRKVPLTVTGDGENKLSALILSKERARMQWFRLKYKLGPELYHVPKHGEEVMLESIGNHSRGATFYDMNHLRSPALLQAFDRLMHGVEDLYFVRFDLKCESLEKLEQLSDFAIVEINGVGGEPAHIYDPDNNPWSYYRDMFRHWRSIYQIAKKNHDLGIPYMSFGKGVRAFMDYRSLVKGSYA